MTNKIVALLMIKNESRIIKRCIEHLRAVADAFYFYDTGSTDNTIECIKEAFDIVSASEMSCPYEVGGTPFINFGASRTASFKGCVEWVRDGLGWDLDTVYALAVDADMNLVVGPQFSKETLTSTGYSLIQKNPSIEYYNMRLLRLSYPWTCVGATHEYWSGEGTGKLGKDYLYIDDRNDGGCKADKFERDERLLRAELEAEPTNPRTHFYLAQTCESTGKKREAISLYKKRIELGGWYEEVWYAHYRIARNYKDLGDYAKMELWTERAYAYYPRRSEALYMCLRHFMDARSYEKAYYYYKKGVGIPYPSGDSLFIETAVYEGAFDFEYTVMYYYIFPDNREKGARPLIEYVNRWPAQVKNTFENMLFYVRPVGGEKTYFNFPDMGQHEASNTSIIPYASANATGYLMNVRYIDYKVENGAYIWKQGSRIDTRNFIMTLNKEFRPTSALQEVSYKVDEKAWKTVAINGFEDVRLYMKDGAIHFYGSCSNLNESGNIEIAHGRLDVGQASAHDICSFKSPQGRGCEKNWVFMPGGGPAKYIYEWHPYTIYNASGELVLKKDTPRYMKEWRGSTTVVHYRGAAYVLIHHVVFREGKRVYLHVLVELDVTTMEPRRHTLPFCFEAHQTEYCIGMALEGPWAYFVYTVTDVKPALKQVYFDNFEWTSI
jgi:tetratricopeptide (TPR) repeat protein